AQDRPALYAGADLHRGPLDRARHRARQKIARRRGAPSRRGERGMIESTQQESTSVGIAAELRHRRAFVMVSHVKPDGDTLGAGLALGLALKKLGKRV